MFIDSEKNIAIFSEWGSSDDSDIRTNLEFNLRSLFTLFYFVFHF